MLIPTSLGEVGSSSKLRHDTVTWSAWANRPRAVSNCRLPT